MFPKPASPSAKCYRSDVRRPRYDSNSTTLALASKSLFSLLAIFGASALQIGQPWARRLRNHAAVTWVNVTSSCHPAPRGYHRWLSGSPFLIAGDRFFFSDGTLPAAIAENACQTGFDLVWYWERIDLANYGFKRIFESLQLDATTVPGCIAGGRTPNFRLA